MPKVAGAHSMKRCEVMRKTLSWWRCGTVWGHEDDGRHTDYTCGTDEYIAQTAVPQKRVHLQSHYRKPNLEPQVCWHFHPGPRFYPPEGNQSMDNGVAGTEWKKIYIEYTWNVQIPKLFIELTSEILCWFKFNNKTSLVNTTLYKIIFWY